MSSVYRLVAPNPQCSCEHFHMLFVKGGNKPHKFRHAHPHKAHKTAKWAFHKHSPAQKALLK